MRARRLGSGLVVPFLIAVSVATAGSVELNPPTAVAAAHPAGQHGVAWAVQFGSVGWDAGRGVAVDSTGAIYVTGVTHGALPGQAGSGASDVFVRKYHKTGVEAWTRQFGTSDYDEGASVAVDSTDSVYVTGFTEGTLPGQTSTGDRDVFVRKYNTTGTEKWTRQFGTNGPDGGTAVAVDAAGSIYVTGAVEGALPKQTSAGEADVFVRKYDATGAEVWTRQFGTRDHDLAYGVAADAAHGIHVAGQTWGALPGQTWRGASDAFVRNYDTTGTHEWTRQFGTAGSDVAHGVAIDDVGAAYATGAVAGKLPGQTWSGERDAFLRKYDATGAHAWSHQFAAIGREWGHAAGYAIAVADDGAISVAGYSEAEIPCGWGDAFVRSYDTSGAELWLEEFGTYYGERGRDLALDASGTMYVTGETFGTFPGQVSLGGDDVFIAKLVPLDLSGPHMCHGLNATIVGTDGDDVLVGSAGTDVIVGLGGRDTIWGMGGNDTICGGGGKDWIDPGFGVDWVHGQHGADTVSYGSAACGSVINLATGKVGGLVNGFTDDDTIVSIQHAEGTWSNDVIKGDDAANVLQGKGASDTLIGRGGNDTLRGGHWSDTLYGGEGDDTLFGGAHIDQLYGGAGVDTLFGGSGPDTLVGGPDFDKLYGGSQKDKLVGHAGRDELWGEDGNDTLSGGGQRDILHGGNGADLVLGGAGGDRMWGEAGDDTLKGGPDDDILRGGTGDDFLDGNTGSDTLYGGPNTDTCVGETVIACEL